MIVIRPMTKVIDFKKNQGNNLPMDAITKAIECLGSQDQLAKAVEVTQAAISQYVTGNKRPSAEVAIRIEEATGGKVRVEDIRPDISWNVIRGTKAA